MIWSDYVSGDEIKIWNPEEACLYTLKGDAGTYASFFELRDGSILSVGASSRLKIWYTRALQVSHCLEYLINDDEEKLANTKTKRGGVMPEASACILWRMLSEGAEKSSVKSSINEFIEKCYIIPASEHYKAAYEALRDNKPTTFATIIKEHPQCLQEQDAFGWRLLHHAAALGQGAAISAMEKARVDLNQTDPLGRTFLHILAAHGYAKLLVKYTKSQPNQADGVGELALHHAARHRQLSSVKVLCGIFPGSVSKKSVAGETPKAVARKAGFTGVQNYITSKEPRLFSKFFHKDVPPLKLSLLMNIIIESFTRLAKLELPNNIESGKEIKDCLDRLEPLLSVMSRVKSSDLITEEESVQMALEDVAELTRLTIDLSEDLLPDLKETCQFTQNVLITLKDKQAHYKLEHPSQGIDKSH